MAGLKHLVACHCVLRIFSHEDDVQHHKFPVYSKIDELGKIIPKLVKCNNCQSLHHVYDYCKSDLRGGKDESPITLSIDDISLSMPNKLVQTLSKLDCDISTWEHCLDIIEESRWGEHVIVSRDVIDENEHIKILFINSEDKFKIENKVINTLVVEREVVSG